VEIGSFGLELLNISVVNAPSTGVPNVEITIVDPFVVVVLL